jgi:phosphoribosylglycinamide formyltransferase-1
VRTSASSGPLALGVLISGRGTNLRALVDAIAAGRLTARVAVVLSNVADAEGVAWARAQGLAVVVVPHGASASREQFDTRVVEILRRHGVELVVLAGFMRVVTRVLLDAFPARVVNVHPALLPAYPGLHAARQALAHGVRVTGVTVHFVDDQVDHGPILAQAAVPVLPDDTEETLHARIQAQEHRLYPFALQLIAEGRVQLEGGRVRVAGGAPPEGTALLCPDPDTVR